ncbi:hypothetical protein [Rhizorhabdus argentea]|uniref:hypothetical protein n=1 Tax=Rhizorhabdus argentea TaxID=1387174 RepID=UPI0030ED54D8
MRFVRTAIIAAAASAALAGAAIAARDNSKLMLVALPDGSVEHIRYEGDVAPEVMLVDDPAPAQMFAAAFGPGSPFAEMERISAAMEAQAQAMMRQAAAMQAQQPAADGKGILMTNAAGQPVGVMHYSYVSSTTTADGCTQTVQYSSDGSSNQPKLIRTSAGSCGAANAVPAITPTSAAPAHRPAPKITPVSATKPLPQFTPSRT